MTFEEIEHQLLSLLGEIGENDRYHYALLLDAWRTYINAGDDVAKNGLTISSGTRLFVNPACNVRNEAHKQIVKLLKHFGIEPLKRSDLPEREDDEEMKELIEGND